RLVRDRVGDGAVDERGVHPDLRGAPALPYALGGEVVPGGRGRLRERGRGRGEEEGEGGEEREERPGGADRGEAVGARRAVRLAVRGRRHSFPPCWGERLHDNEEAGWGKGASRSRRELDLRLLRVSAVEDRGAADDLNQLGAVDAGGEVFGGLACRRGRGLEDLDLEELAGVEGVRDGAGDGVGHA